MNAITSKEFNSKKSAQASARKIYGSDYASKVTIDEIDETWYITEIVAPVADAEPEEAAPVADAQKSEPEVSETDGDSTEPASQPSDLANLLAYNNGDKEIIEPVKPKAELQKTSGLVIEKDRPEQNGVKRPSAGGLCRAVWDACWLHQEKTGEVPTAKQVKEIAVAQGWNPNNASIEYYQWRKYNGISGRVAKVEVKKPETQVFGNPVSLPITIPSFI